MAEIQDFATIVLVVAAGLSLAVATSKLTERFPIPAPALFLLAAAVASDLFPELREPLSIQTVERIAVVALIVILFEGGMDIGWRRFRGSLVPITLLGVPGTFATAGIIAAVAHGFLGFDWTTAWIVGAALAPTDPAVMFSVLGNREVGGRTGTILEGESGANDPVGIALMIGVLEFATHDDGSVWMIVREFSLEMAVGLVVGVGGAALLVPLVRRISLPSVGLYPIRVLAMAGLLYGVASLLGGSGFLAVFVAGLLFGDARVPYRGEVDRFFTPLASLAEVSVFVALGLTIDLRDLLNDYEWLDGMLLALVLALVARPLAVGLLLLPARLTNAERVFVMWSGLKGAVPILLAAFAVLAGADEADRIYGIVFVVVAFSVVAQGSTIPYVARRLGIPMHTVEPEPWSVSVRLRSEPDNVTEFVVASGSAAVGREVRQLPLGDHGWISLVVTDGRAHEARGSYVVREGDQLLVVSEPDDVPALRTLFEADG